MSGPALASGSPQKRKKISGEGDFVKGAIGKSFGLLCVFVYGGRGVDNTWSLQLHIFSPRNPPAHTPPYAHSLPTYPITHRDATALHCIHSFLQCV